MTLEKRKDTKKKETNIRLRLYNWHALPVSKEYL